MFAITPEDSLSPAGGGLNIVACDKTSPSLVYAGGDGGLFRSQDGGTNWTRSQGITGAGARAVVISSQTADRLFLINDTGLFRSDDGAITWAPVRSTDLALDRPPLALAEHNGALWVGTESGLLRSSDAGLHWQLPAFTGMRIPAVAIDRATSQIYAAAGDRVLVGRNGGTEWTIGESAGAPIRALLVRAGIGLLAATDGAGIKSTLDGMQWSAAGLPSGSIVSLAENPTDRTQIAAGGAVGVFLTIDGGHSWKLCEAGAVRAITWSADGRQLFAAGPRGLISCGHGAGEAIPGPQATHITSLARDARSPNHIYAGAREGLWRSAGSQQWVPVFGRTEVAVTSLTIAGASLLAGTATAVTRLAGTMREHTSMPDVLALGNLSQTEVLTVARDGARLSADCGSTWSAPVPLPEGALGISVLGGTGVPTVAYVGTEGSGAFSSVDHGRTWVEVSRTLRRSVVRTMVADPNNPYSLYIGGDQGVLATADGLNWNPMNTGLPRTIVYSLLIDATDPQQPMYAGTAAGVFVTTDRSTWTPLGGDDLPPITCLLLDKDNTRLLLGTFGAGVLALPLPGTPKATTN
jgi:photosystem II stability/assembly factor-like uncharacterized protein